MPARKKNSARNTAGSIRDQLVRDALSVVTATYDVCIDADTVSSHPLNKLVGALVAGGFDIASVPLIAANRDVNLLTRLQAHEYRMAMRLRRLAPWLISGACHVARARAHRAVMARHSLFFQGNDVELGLIGKALGYKIGHINFEVPTDVPETFKAWRRQRWAWTGGEFRLFIVNFRFIVRHPFLYSYGAGVVIAMTIARWWSLFDVHYSLLGVFIAYVSLLLAVNWRDRDRSLFILPFYALFCSLLLVPFGWLSYLQMARQDGNYGWFKTKDMPKPSKLQPVIDLRERQAIALANQQLHKTAS